MVIFNSYVKLPEGIILIVQKKWRIGSHSSAVHSGSLGLHLGHRLGLIGAGLLTLLPLLRPKPCPMVHCEGSAMW